MINHRDELLRQLDPALGLQYGWFTTDTGEKSRWEGVQIVYTKEGQTCDAYIEAMAVRIGGNYSVRVVTSDALVQLSSFRSGLLRMSARELWEAVDDAQDQIRVFLTELRQKENRKFQSK